VALLAVLTGLSWVLGPGRAAAGPKSDSVVKVTVQAEKPTADGQVEVTLTVAIDKGWHVYAHPVNNPTFERNQTLVSLDRDQGELGKVDYPAGKLVKDDDLGNYQVYEGSVDIKATVSRPKGLTGPLKLTVKVVACDAKNCLPAAIIPVEVPVP
jgi:DsbC/DsbD-like thiol-disulfide interchange protein